MGCSPSIPTIFVSQSAPVWGAGSSFSLAPVFLCFLFFFFLYDTVCHHRILQDHLPLFPALDLKYTTASKVSFIGKWDLETKI